MLTPRMFAVRGIPLTLVLLSFLLVPAAYRSRRVGRVFLVSFSMLLVAALLAGVPFRGAGELLPAQTGVALLLLLPGWLAALPRGWALTMAAGTMLADGTSLLLGTAVRAVGWAVLLESFWAPLFGAALVVLLANMRRQEERRDFMLLRQAAFAGVPGGASTTSRSSGPAMPRSTSRHLDPQTGAANRLAFEMRFRAAWDQAAGRRHSIALLFFSIDGLSEQRRDLGLSFTELVQAQVAGLLKDGLRRSDDMVARFDQQHFVVMLPGVGTDGATQIAERLRGSVEEMGVYAGQKRHSATVTVGAASLRAKRGWMAGHVVADRLRGGSRLNSPHELTPGALYARQLSRLPPSRSLSECASSKLQKGWCIMKGRLKDPDCGRLRSSVCTSPTPSRRAESVVCRC